MISRGPTRRDFARGLALAAPALLAELLLDTADEAALTLIVHVGSAWTPDLEHLRVHDALALGHRADAHDLARDRPGDRDATARDARGGVAPAPERGGGDVPLVTALGLRGSVGSAGLASLFSAWAEASLGASAPCSPSWTTWWAVEAISQTAWLWLRL